jgi:hypothetical protein
MWLIILPPKRVMQNAIFVTYLHLLFLSYQRLFIKNSLLVRVPWNEIQALSHFAII